MKGRVEDVELALVLRLEYMPARLFQRVSSFVVVQAELGTRNCVHLIMLKTVQHMTCRSHRTSLQIFLPGLVKHKHLVQLLFSWGIYTQSTAHRAVRE